MHAGRRRGVVCRRPLIHAAPTRWRLGRSEVVTATPGLRSFGMDELPDAVKRVFTERDGSVGRILGQLVLTRFINKAGLQASGDEVEYLILSEKDILGVVVE